MLSVPRPVCLILVIFSIPTRDGVHQIPVKQEEQVVLVLEDRRVLLVPGVL
jgi:hypothetical protein